MTKSLFFLSIIAISAGCGQQVEQMANGDSPFSNPNNPNVQDPNNSCAPMMIKNQYIVSWKDGRVTRHHAESDEAFVRDVVVPNKEKIEVAEPDMRVSIPEKDLATQQVSAQAITQADNWGQIKINAGAAWSQGAKGNGVIVAVIDTGLDRTHPQLAQQLALNAGEMGNDTHGRDKSSNNVDDDGNGFIDDWNGFNFVTHTGNATDDNGHGTHVSGIIAAQHSDTQAAASSHVEGIAPQAKILPLKFLDSSGAGNISDAVSAIDYAVARGAKVINASWGGTACSATLQSRIANLANKNILFVAAAGNDGVDLAENPRYPASFSFVSQITVGATGLFDAMADYSNYGDQAVHIFSPGTLVISTYPGGGMASMSGTSMATPFVTGTAALVYGAHPDATIAQVRAALLASVSTNASYHNATQGRIDLTNLLQNFHGQ